MPFRDRREAGRRLAERLSGLRATSPLVLGLPRGGVPVAYEVAKALGSPLDILVVRKLGVPFQPELGMGAVGEDGVRVLNADVLRQAGVNEAQLAQVEARERAEVEERATRLRGGRPAIPLQGRTVVIVDDGLATGGTARAAVHVARSAAPARVILAVPVAPPETVATLRRDADDVVAVETPEPFFAIGGWYSDFSPTSDDEVVELLVRAAVSGADKEVVIPAEGRQLAGHLTIPSGARGLVVFAHGSGSGRHSPRNQAVARCAERRRTRHVVVRPPLARRGGRPRERVRHPAPGRAPRRGDHLGARPGRRSRALPIGFFGASTGAGAALWAAAEPDSPVRAIVSRGGRPDLAGARLDSVRAPTLLIVGGRDEAVLEMNRDAARHLTCEHRIEVVPGATHLFEEPGALEAVADLAARWFLEHLAGTRP